MIRKKRFDRSIVIYGKSMDPNYIRAYHGCYDPLAYPLFFLGGETGWEDKHRQADRVQSTTTLKCEEEVYKVQEKT
jgi:hypothetical protein